MRTILYLGLKPPKVAPDEHLIHYPIIKIVPRPLDDPAIANALNALPSCSHLIFTSQVTVQILKDYLTNELRCKKILAVGKATAAALTDIGFPATKVAEEETAEGIIALLEKESFAHCFWAHSSRARKTIKNYLENKAWPLTECDLYDTKVNTDLKAVPLEVVDEIYFTSPSTVDAFIEVYGRLPLDKRFKTIGPVTENYLAASK